MSPNIAPTKYECLHRGIAQPPWATNETFRRVQYLVRSSTVGGEKQHDSIEASSVCAGGVEREGGA